MQDKKLQNFILLFMLHLFSNNENDQIKLINAMVTVKL